MTDPHHIADNRELSEKGDIHAVVTPGHPPLGVVARAVVERIIDGDTLQARIEWPFRIRLVDCWAPEVRGSEREAGQASKEHLEKLAPVGSPVVVAIDSEKADSLGDLLTFGRIVGHVWREGDVESLSQIMVGAGFATAEKQR